MIVQIVQKIDGSVEMVEETTTCSQRQPSRFHPYLTEPSKTSRKTVAAEQQNACLDIQKAIFDLPSPNLRLANLMGPIIGLLKTFSSQVSRCKKRVR